MPAFDANIRLLVEAKDALRQIKKLEDRLASLEATATGKRTAAQVRSLIRTEEAGVQVAQRRLEKEIALASATELYARRKQQLERAGGATNKQLQAQIGAIEKLVELQGSNVGVMQRAATLTGRVLERQRELNRSQKEYNARASRITTEYASRIFQLKNIGIAESKLNTIIKARDELVQLNDRRQHDLAKAQEDRLKRLLNSQERLNESVLKPTRQLASPIRGTKDIVGSPKYVEAQNKKLAQQEKDRLKVQEALEKLNKRDVSLLQQKLNINRRITNEFSLQAQQEQERAQRGGAGLSRPIPTPYRTAGSMGFPVALPVIAQDRRIQAAKAARESAQAALSQQKVNSILVQGVTVLKAQVAIAKQLDGVYDGIVASLTRANERQSQLFRARANRTERQQLGNVSVKLLQEINNLSTGINQKESIKNKLFTAGVKIKNNEFDAVKRIQREVRELIKAEDARIDRARRLVKFRQSEAKATKQRRTQRTENLLLGAGFPLVTGGGLGSVVGGAAGALLQQGGGFGLGVFLSGVGQKLDQFVQSQAQVASSIQESTDVFGTLESAGFKVSGALKAVVQRLEEAGDAAGAYRLKLRELEKAYGANAVRDLNNFDRANQRISDSFKRLTSTLFPPLIRLFTAISYVTSGVVNNLAKLFEFFTGASAEGGRARPDVRLEGEFAQAGAFERELANRPLVSREELTQSTFKQSRFFQQYEKDQKTLKENQAIVDSINRRQREAQEQRIRKATEIRRIENEIKQIAVDKARLDLNILNRRLSIESQIRQAEITREKAVVKGAQAYAAAAEVIARQNVKNIELGRELFAPEGDETYINQIEKAAKAQKALIEASVDELSQALGDAGIYSDTVVSSIIFRYRDALQNAIDIRAEEEKRLFITKDAAYQKRTDLINAEVGILTAATEEEANRLRLIQLQNEAREQAKQEGITDPALVEKRVQAVTAKFAAQNKKVSELNQFITQATDELNNLEATAVRVAQGIGDAIGNSLASGISRLIEGSAKAKEVFADMLKSIGQILVQEGTKMIATYIAIGIARAFAGFYGTKDLGFSKAAGTTAQGEFSNFFQGFTAARSSGGPVERNRTYMVGEQGPELFTPSQAGRISSTSETRSLLGRSPVGNAPAMNFTFETTNIGGQEFVSREQLEAAMAVTRKQAANDGARKGMGMTLDKMQHSPATRRRVGIS